MLLSSQTPSRMYLLLRFSKTNDSMFCRILNIKESFSHESSFAIPFTVTSYNDKAFSIFFAIEKLSYSKEHFDKNEIVLPEKWLEALQAK